MIKKNGPYKILSVKKIYKSKWINLHEDRIIHPSGKSGIFGIVELVPVVFILPINSKQEVFLVREYSYAIEEYTIKVAGGDLEKNETPLKTAKRELREELGITAKSWNNLGLVHPYTKTIKSPNYLFLAKDIKEGVVHADDYEKINKIKMPLSKAVQMVYNGKITHSASCVLILKAKEMLNL